MDKSLRFPRIWSVSKRNNVLTQYYKYFYKKCPINEITDDKGEIKAVFCDAKVALRCHLETIINAKVTHGYSIIHASQFNETCQIIQVNLSNLDIYNVRYGSRIWIVKHVIQVILTGDGATFTHVPGAPKPMSFCFIRPIILNDKVAQCPQSAKLLLASSYSESDPELRGVIDEVRKNLDDSGHILCKIKDNSNVDYCLIKYKQYAGGDWKWCFNLWNYSISPAGKFAIIGAVFWFNGIPYGIHENIYYLTFVNFTDPEFAPNINEAFKQKWSGFTCATQEVHKFWGMQVDECVNEFLKSHGVTMEQMDVNNLHEIRKYFAMDNLHGILSYNNNNPLSIIFDVWHFFWSFMVTWLGSLLIFMQYVWGWDADQIRLVLKALQEESISQQWEEYYKYHKSHKKCKQWIKFRANGRICMEILSKWNIMLLKAAWIAQENEEANAFGEHTASSIIALMFCCMRKMRFVFYCLMKTKFVKHGDYCYLMHQMIECAQDAMYICYNFCSVLVCFYIWQ